MLTAKLRAARRARPALRALASALALAMLCLPVGGLVQAAQAAPNNTGVAGVAASSILLFPFANNTGKPDADYVGPRIDDALRLRLNTVGAFKVTSYTRFLAPVQRAVDDKVLTPDAVAGPFTDAQKAGPVAEQIGTDAYLIGAVELFSSDPMTRKVSVEVSADLRNTATGNSLRTLAFTGTAGPISASDTLENVTQNAINSAASKVAAALNAGRPSQSALLPSSQRGQSNAGQVFLLTVLTGALLYAILHNSSNGNGGGSNSTTVTGSGTGTSGSSGSSGPPAPPGS